jgi:hypothetical protein
MSEACQRCEEVEEDRRTLWMACFYEMGEMKIPFETETFEMPDGKISRSFYTLRVCKTCRADWMQAIKTWFSEKPKTKFVGSGIFIRELRKLVEISNEEWDRRIKLKDSQ